MRGLIINHELEGIWKGAVVTSVKVLSLHLPRTEENHKMSEDNRSASRDLNSGLSFDEDNLIFSMT